MDIDYSGNELRLSKMKFISGKLKKIQLKAMKIADLWRLRLILKGEPHPGGGGGGKDSHIKVTGAIVGNFEK